MRFRVIANSANVPSEGKDIAYLWTDNWNDWYEYRTLYVVTLFDSEGIAHDLGGVKIGEFDMPKDRSRPDLPTSFTKLPKRFFSLGQDVSYYSTIANLDTDIASEFLRGLRDIVDDVELRERALEERVTGVSLMRFVSMRSIDGQFKRVLEGGAPLTEYSFNYKGPTPETEGVDPIKLEFKVTPDSMPPTNIHVLIGSNGAGKTFLLNRMTRALVLAEPDPGEEGMFQSSDLLALDENANPFANIISVSFSAFDDFALLPERRNASRGTRYSSIGLRQRVKDKSDRTITVTRDPEELGDEFVKSARACVWGDKSERWRRALGTLQTDALFEEVNVAALASVSEADFTREAQSLWKTLSSGHKIVLLFITKLVEKVEERTLVLMDEPEAHLHPPLLSAFIRALSDLLIHRNGVAVIATHSPVVLQEIPASCVYKVIRHGGSSRADRPTVETFAENVGVLTREAFKLEVTRSGFHKMLSEASEGSASILEVLAKFDNEVGADGRALISAAIAANNVLGE